MQKDKLTDSLKVDLHIAREMEIEQAPSLVFSENVHEEGLKVEGLYPYHIYTYIINELMGQPIEKNLPPKLEYYIQKETTSNNGRTFNNLWMAWKIIKQKN